MNYNFDIGLAFKTNKNRKKKWWQKILPTLVGSAKNTSAPLATFSGVNHMKQNE